MCALGIIHGSTTKGAAPVLKQVDRRHDKPVILARIRRHCPRPLGIDDVALRIRDACDARVCSVAWPQAVCTIIIVFAVVARWHQLAYQVGLHALEDENVAGPKAYGTL